MNKHKTTLPKKTNSVTSPPSRAALIRKIAPYGVVFALVAGLLIGFGLLKFDRNENQENQKLLAEVYRLSLASTKPSTLDYIVESTDRANILSSQNPGILASYTFPQTDLGTEVGILKGRLSTSGYRVGYDTNNILALHNVTGHKDTFFISITLDYNDKPAEYDVGPTPTLTQANATPVNGIKFRLIDTSVTKP